jgi:alkylation response protein AidB-like acyl-CoA dehydrogenase
MIGDGGDLTRLRCIASNVGAEMLAANAEQIDAKGIWPAENMQALAEAGLLGLHVPTRLGGHGQGMLALAVICEELARHCGSTAMCFGMHCVATQVLVAKATQEHEARYLRPIARGEHVTALALSEPGTGANFYLPRAHFRPADGGFLLSGRKSFVTSGGHADSYVVSVAAPGGENDPGTFTFLMVDGGTDGLRWGDPWRGFGMRGNSSRSLEMSDVRVPAGNLLGGTGDQIWYVFEVVAPYFLIAMSGVYLGLAAAALDLAIEHLKTREQAHTGERLRELPVLWPEVAQSWTELEATRQLVQHAARLGDAGHPEAPLALFAAKARVAGTCTQVTDTAMALMGGRGYGEHSAVGRMLRDARAAHVMSPTTHMVETWLGRSLLGLPPL